MSHTNEQSVASQLVRLFTDFPCAGTNDAGFGLELPRELSEASYQLIVDNIEFRRKCMHQGFDNLLELLKLHHDAMRKYEAISDKAKADEAKE